MRGQSPMGCGICQFYTCVDPEQELFELCTEMYTGANHFYSIICWSNLIEDTAYEKKYAYRLGTGKVKWDDKFLKLIEEHKLGTVSRSEPTRNNVYSRDKDNNGTGSLIAVYTLNLEHHALKAWWNKKNKALT